MEGRNKERYEIQHKENIKGYRKAEIALGYIHWEFNEIIKSTLWFNILHSFVFLEKNDSKANKNTMW